MITREQIRRDARRCARMVRIARGLPNPGPVCVAVIRRLACLILAGHEAEKTDPGAFGLAICCAGAVADMLPAPAADFFVVIAPGNARPERN